MMNAVKVPVRVCACAAAMLAVMPAQSVTYGFRARHPAVVNPVLGEENTISLRGEWDFIQKGLTLLYKVVPVSGTIFYVR